MIRFQRFLKVLLCAGMLSMYFGCAASKTHESTGQYVDDSVITTKVKAALMNDISLKAFQIKVTTFKGVVQLSGFVDSADHADWAAEVARGVNGVREVKNDLIVK